MLLRKAEKINSFIMFFNWNNTQTLWDTAKNYGIVFQNGTV